MIVVESMVIFSFYVSGSFFFVDRTLHILYVTFDLAS